MPSHLRMEEASSVISSKSISAKLGRSDNDDLDDFVLQIDENEINNEIIANGLVEDVTNDALKTMENIEGTIINSSKTDTKTKESMKCGINSGLENGTDEKSCDFHTQDRPNVSESTNGLSDEQHLEMETESESQNSSEKHLEIDASPNTDMEAELENQDNSKTELKLEASISMASNKTDNVNKKTLGAINDNESAEMKEGKNNTLPIEKGDVAQEKNPLDLNKSPKAGSLEMKEDTNEFIAENLESVDKELDSLLSIEPEVESEQSNNIPEPMEVDPSPNELSVVQMTTIEHSPSILLELQNQDDKMDSDLDVTNQNTAPDSPTITMHSPQTLNDLDENSSSSDGSSKEKIVKAFSKVIKIEGETAGTEKEEFIYHNVKHIQISAQSSVLKENKCFEKRPKREADKEIISNDHKKIKLEKDPTVGLTPKNDVEVKKKLNVSEIIKKESDSSSESNDESGSSTSNDSSDESVDSNGTEGLKKILHIKNKIKNEELSPEELKEIVNARGKLFANYFEGKTEITVNRYVLEEMVLAQIVEMISYKTDVGMLRQQCRILQSDQRRLNQMVNALKKQAENARIIIKRLIDEKTSHKNWTQTAIPLKVTRSVGLQVCTCGSMTVRSKASDKECKALNSDNVVTRGSANNASKTDKDSNVSKVGPFDNKENISSNIEKDVATNKDNSNTDDVVIVSVTESNSTSTSTSVNKKILEVPKNGITHTEKVVRKPLIVEFTNSPTTPNKTPVVSNQKKIAIDKPLEKKESVMTIKNDVSEIIDLTDKEDNPVKKLEASSKSVPASNSEKRVSAIMPMKIANPQSTSLVTVNGIKKPSLPSSTATNKKLIDIAPAADLVNSYDHLPKYPASPKYPPNVVKPPRPILRIGKNTSGKQGIMLSWSFEGGRNPPNIDEYQLYALQETKNSEKYKSDAWSKVGDIKALPLPMACFLTQFIEGHKYHFIVRAVDTQKRLGDFSLPGSIILHAAGQPPSAS